MAPSRARKIREASQGRFFSANGSAMERSAFSGSRAAAVSEDPKGMLIFARAFTAQPLASRMGPRFLFLSLSHARRTEGHETTRISAANNRGTCHQARRNSPAMADAKAAPIAPIASPIAAKIPANLATSKGGGGGGTGSPAAVFSAACIDRKAAACSDARDRAAEIFWNCSPIIRATLL